MITVKDVLARAVAREREAYLGDARRIVELASKLAETAPSGDVPVSGEIARLSQYVNDLLRRAVALETTCEAMGLLEAEAGTKKA